MTRDCACCSCRATAARGRPWRTAQAAQAAGYTHILTMDSDGQHPADHIGRFMAASLAEPGALILGDPQFDASAPALRVQGRKLSNFWANVETLWAGIHDSLFGFRVYPSSRCCG
jgi:hypothetical protein